MAGIPTLTQISRNGLMIRSLARSSGSRELPPRQTSCRGAAMHSYLRKKAAGLQHLSAVTAVAIKLCHVTWRILTDRRDYLPQPPTSSGPSSRQS